MLFTTISNKFFKAFRRNTRRSLPARNRLPRRLVVEQLEDRCLPSSLAFSTYLGGPGDDVGTAIAADASGNSYVAGTTLGSFPVTPGAYDTTYNGGQDDVFVAKFDTSGSLLWSTYLGGPTYETALGIAVDSAGNVYVTGQAGGAFPTTAGAYQTAYHGGTYDAFVTKLNASGSAIIYSTYLGGSADDYGGLNIAVDASGNAYIGGSTRSSDFPTTPGAFQTTKPGFEGVNSATVTKLNATGSALIYSTYLGGTNFFVYSEGVYGIAVDGSGNAYVTGLTAATDFPTTAGAFQATSPGGGPNQVFVTKLNPTGSGLIYSTYLGGSGGSIVSSGIAIDSSGDAYVTGATGSSNFPTTPGAAQTTFAGGSADAFVSKLNATGSALVFSTYLGGSGNDYAPSYGGGIGLDASGNVYVTGYTTSTNFPTADAVQSTYGGGTSDAYAAKLNANGTALVYSTYLGGSGADTTSLGGIAVDGSGNAYVTGSTSSTDFPTANAFQATYGGGSGDAFIAKITTNQPPTADAGGPYTVPEGGSITLTGSGSDPDGDPLTYAWDLDNDGTFETAGQNVTFSAAGLDGPSSQTVVLQVSDDHGGSVTSPVTIAITNVAPTAALSNNGPVFEGSPATFSFSANDQSPTDQAAGFTYAINWGDGSALTIPRSAGNGTGVAVDHIYTHAGTYAAMLEATDKDGGKGTDIKIIAIANAAPTAALSNNGPVREGSPATVAFSNQFDPSTADTAAGFHYSFALTPAGLATTYAAASDGASKQFTFDDNGSYSVYARIFDQYDAYTQYTTTVVVSNVAPTAAITGAPASSPEGTRIDLTSTVTDPSSADTAAGFTYAWTVTKNGSAYASGTASSFSLTPDDNGTYVVALEATDKDGGKGTDSKTIAITNVAPTAALANNGPVFEGSPATVSFSNQFDASPADTAAGFHYSFALTPAGLAATYGGATDGASEPFTFDDNGSYTVYGRIFDKDNDYTQYTTTVVATNVAPTAAITGAPASRPEGTEIDLTGTVTDPSSADTAAGFTYAWTLTRNGSAFVSETGALTFSFIADDDGTYVVSLQATDKDGSQGTDSKTIAIINVAPTASLSNNGPVGEGSAVTVSLSGANDPSPADTATGFHYTFALTPAGLASTYAAAGAASSASFTFPDNGDYPVYGRVFDKDDGYSDYQTTVHVNNVAPAAPSGSVTLDFDSVTPNAGKGTAYLASYGITLTNITPSGPAGVVDIVNFSGPGSLWLNDNFLIQNGAGAVPCSYTMNFSTPLLSISFKRFATPPNLTTEPVWSATAYVGSEPVGTVGESRDSWGNSPARSFTLTGNGITSLTISANGFGTAALGSVPLDDFVLTTQPGIAMSGIYEGQSVTLGGSFTDPGTLDTHTVVINWGDGSPNTTVNLGADVLTFSGVRHQYLDNPAGQPNGSFSITVTVTDKDGGTASGGTSVQVNNLPPTASLAGPALGVPGQPRTFSFSANDPSPTDLAAGFTYTINWGDGNALTIPRSAGNGAGVAVDHIYTAPGTYTVRVTATDKDNAVSAASTQQVLVQVAQMQGEDLAVGGTPGTDTITLTPANAAGDISVVVNKVSWGNFRLSPTTGHILVYAQSGLNDMVRLVSSRIGGTIYYVTVPAVLYGDGDNDTLDASGSKANNALFGGAGNDNLLGGLGRDLLVGGGGSDKLSAINGGDSILIGGTTDYDRESRALTYDRKLTAVFAIMAEWGRTDLPGTALQQYQTRVAHLASGGRLNGTWFLNATTVHDDGVADTLTGSTIAFDWFFADTTHKDTLKNWRTGEVITYVS